MSRLKIFKKLKPQKICTCFSGFSLGFHLQEYKLLHQIIKQLLKSQELQGKSQIKSKKKKLFLQYQSCFYQKGI
jgi:hypothetical protein